MYFVQSIVSAIQVVVVENLLKKLECSYVYNTDEVGVEQCGCIPEEVSMLLRVLLLSETQKSTQN